MKNRDINHPVVLVATILLTTIGVLMPNIQPLYVGAMADQHGFNSEQLGFLAGIEPLGLALSGALAIFWINHFSWQRAAFFAVAVIMIGNFATPFISDFNTLLWVRGLTGFFGEGIAFAIGLTAISESKYVDRNFAYMVMVHVVSMSVCMIALPYSEAAWGLAGFFIPISVFAALLLITPHLIPNTGHKSEQQAADHVHDTGPVFWGLAAQLAWYIGIGGLWAFIERIGVNAGLEKTDIGLALGIAIAVSISGSILATFTADKFGRMLPFCISMAIQFVTVFLLLDVSSLLVYGLIWTVFNSVWNYALPYIYAAVAEADYSGRFVVIVPTSQCLGLAIGTSVGGILVSEIGLSAVIYQSAVLSICAALLFAVLARRSREATSQQCSVGELGS